MIFGRGRVLSARERRTPKPEPSRKCKSRMSTSGLRRDPIECVSFGVDGVDQICVGQPVNELDEAGREQRGILDEQHA